MESRIPPNYSTYDMEYEFTPKTFRKTSQRPFTDKRIDGTPFVWARSWNHERIMNEVRALQIVSGQTTIPVPRLLDYGGHPDGRKYLETEFINGVSLDAFKRRACSKPNGQSHSNDNTPCKVCLDQAHENALYFINTIVLPQLARLKSQTRGIDGFVMPPSWLTPDAQPPWEGRTYRWKTLPLKGPEYYVFQHGDIKPLNILMDPETLQPKVLIDWEHAGYFPPEMERWPGTLLDVEAYKRRGTDIAHAIAKYLPIDYLECYKSWKNQAMLEELVKSGKLPDPAQIEQGHKE